MHITKSCTKLINFCTQRYDEFKADYADTFEAIEDSWNHYNGKFGLMKGLVITPILTTTAAYLFNTSTPFVGTLFGVINYATLFFAIEASREGVELEKFIIPITVLNGVVTQAIVNKICHQQLNRQAATILTIAAFAGQILRLLLVREHISTSKRL